MCLKNISSLSINTQANALEESQAFLERLVRVSELQLLQYDAMMVIDDVDKGSMFDF